VRQNTGHLAFFNSSDTCLLQDLIFPQKEETEFCFFDINYLFFFYAKVQSEQLVVAT